MARLSPAAQDKQWEREDDARTLARAEEIRSSKARLSGAVKEAKVMVKKTEKEAKAMAKVATLSRTSPVKKGNAKVSSNTKTPLSLAKKRK